MPSLRFIRLVIALAQEKTGFYVYKKGSQCPVCLELGFESGWTQCYATVAPIRYFKCPQCGANFKSTNTPDRENDVTEPIPVRLPKKPRRR